MKRYLVFEYDDYYPLGGMGDFYRDYSSLEEMKEDIKIVKPHTGIDIYVNNGKALPLPFPPESNWRRVDNLDIYDQQEGKEVEDRSILYVERL